jgi:hypothetical protein
LAIAPELKLQRIDSGDRLRQFTRNNMEVMSLMAAGQTCRKSPRNSGSATTQRRTL